MIIKQFLCWRLTPEITSSFKQNQNRKKVGSSVLFLCHLCFFLTSFSNNVVPSVRCSSDSRAAQDGGIRLPVALGDGGKVTHLELLLNYFHVVSLQKVQLVGAHPVQLREQIGKEHSSQGFIIGSRVPGRTHTHTHTHKRQKQYRYIRSMSC